MHDIFTLKYGLNLLLCSISSGTWVPSGCRRNWSSNIIIDLSTLWKWRLMVSPERQKKKDIVRVVWLCASMWRNLPTCSSTVARYVSWRLPSLHKMSHKPWKACGPMRIHHSIFHYSKVETLVHHRLFVFLWLIV